MPISTLRRVTIRRADLAACALTVGLCALLPTAAHAAPGTFPDPNGSGASVTLGDTEVEPGQRLEISGQGFVPASGNGFPLIAIKPYDIDPKSPVWTSGGPDRYDRSDDADIWFAAQQPGGRWAGYIDIPSNLTADGLASGSEKGTHWLRVLSGAFSTADAVTVPITYRVPFTVVEPLVTGLTGFGPGARFQRGTTFRPGAAVTLQGQGYTPGATVTVQLDGVALPASITTDATGKLPPTARVTLPATTAPGGHILRLTTGPVAHDQALTVVAPPTASLGSPTVPAGESVSFTLDRWVGVGGAGQKVAVVIDEAVLACVQTDLAGNGSGTFTVPRTAATGTATVGFAAGTSCAGPTGAQDDLPGTRVTATLQVGPPAPEPTPVVVVTERPFADATSAPVTAGAVLGNKAGSAPTATVPGPATPPTMGPATPAASPTRGPATTPSPTATPRRAPAPRVRSASVSATKLTLRLQGRAARGASVTVRTKAQVRLRAGAKPKMVTLVRASTNRVGRVAFRLTPDGRRLLRTRRAVRVVVRISADGRTSSTKTVVLTLRQARSDTGSTS